MSIICLGCRSKVVQPDTPWYAATRFSPTINYLCGTCVATIPIESRKPVDSLQDFELTLGTVFASLGTKRNYNWTESRMGQPLFTVSSEIIGSCLPYSESFLTELYPYWCIDSYCEYVCGLQEHDNVLEKLWIYREPIRKWLSLNRPRPDYTPPEDNEDDCGLIEMTQPSEHRIKLAQAELTTERRLEMQQLSDDLFLKYFKSSSSITSPQSSPLDVAKNPLPNQTKIRFLVEGKEYPSPGLAFEAAIELTRKNKEKNLATNAPTSRSQESMDTITKKQNNGS